MDISKHIIEFEIPDEHVEEYFKRIAAGDPRCRIPVGSRVKKIFAFAENEIHAIGSNGTVVGSIYRVEPEFTAYGVNHDMYFVNFDNAPQHKDVKVKIKKGLHLVQIGLEQGITTACHGVKLMRL